MSVLFQQNGKNFLFIGVALAVLSLHGCQSDPDDPTIHFPNPMNPLPGPHYSSQQINAADNWITLQEGKDVGQYYRSSEGIFWKAKVDMKVAEADAESFQVNKIFTTYAKDKNHAYYFGMPLEVDLGSFAVLDQDFHKDKDQVYSGGHTLEGADPATFQIMDLQETFWKFYSKDKNSVYYQWNKIVAADPATFEPLGQGYAKDKNSIYLNEKELDGSDPTTFEIMSTTGYSRDKNNIYWRGARLPEADPASFQLVDPKKFYGKDKQSVYYYAQKIEGADAGSFELIERSYSKDKNVVYYEEKRLEDSDPGTFKITDVNQLLGRDKNGCYRYEKKENCPDL